jgi:hypothetical protein
MHFSGVVFCYLRSVGYFMLRGSWFWGIDFWASASHPSHLHIQPFVICLRYRLLNQNKDFLRLVILPVLTSIYSTID